MAKVSELLRNGAQDAPLTVVLAHGAGAPMDSPFMEVLARGIADAGYAVVRFEFPYMAARRRGTAGRSPNADSVLLDAWRQVLDTLALGTAPVIGGKSLGARTASLVADEVGARGLVCFGYPFHPPGAPERLRTGHLEDLQTPTLILQGERDPFGRRGEVAHYDLSPALRVEWLTDGDHGFKPPADSSATEDGNLARAVDLAVAFLDDLRSSGSPRKTA